MSDTCEMIEVKTFLTWTDDDQEPNEDQRDVPCTNPAEGTHENDVRVCSECGVKLEAEGFVIRWDSSK